VWRTTELRSLPGFDQAVAQLFAAFD